MELLELLQTTPLLFVSLLFVLGLVIGSFLNVVVYRLPIMLERDWRVSAQEILALEQEKLTTFNLILPNSTCPKCGHQIKPLENIPLISYLVLGGKCANCKNKISLRYPLVELASGLIAAFIGWYFGFSFTTSALLIFSWALLAMSLIDADHQILPDDLVLPLLWLGLIVNQFHLFTDQTSALIGAIAGYLSLWLVYWAFKLLTGKDGIGYGDFKMLAMLGAWAGWQMLPLIVLLSSGVGAILGIIWLKVQKQDNSTPLPFGPYLAIAGWIALIWGDAIINQYLTLLKI